MHIFHLTVLRLQLLVPRSPSATNCSPERLAKLREANAIVKNSWQYKVHSSSGSNSSSTFLCRLDALCT